MKTRHFGAFLVVTIVGVLVLAGCLFFGTVQAMTNVNGIISSDTLWSDANSPYNLTGPVLINSGVTLTIEAGATVNLNSYYIQVNGTLIARGNSTNQIHFIGQQTNRQIVFTDASNNWDDQSGSGCIVENAVLSSTSIEIDNVSPKINDDSITGEIWIAGGSPLIVNNNILGIIVDHGIGTFNISARIYDKGIGGNPTISNNTITGTSVDSVVDIADCSPIISGNNITASAIDSHTTAAFGISFLQNFNVYHYYYNAYISDNDVTGCKVGGINVAGAATLERNLIINNANGVYISAQPANGNPPFVTIQTNTIAYNSIGISGPTFSSTIIYNTIQNNSQNSILLSSPFNVIAIYNYWGTGDVDSINQTIHDFKNDLSLGNVSFVPILMVASPASPLIPAPPSNWPPVEPTDTPTITPTPTPTPVPTTSPTPGPTYVKGIISSNSTWTKIGSPYVLTEPVFVGNGATLSIEPGVTVNLNSFYIQVNGTLRVKGLNDNPVHLNSGQITFTQNSISWNEITADGCTIENAVFHSTALQIENASPKINNNTFTGPFANIGTFNGDNNAISINVGAPSISNNTITNVDASSEAAGIYCLGNVNAVISNNNISDFAKGIFIVSGQPTVQWNFIFNNTGNVQNGDAGIEIETLPEVYTASMPLIQNNSIINNCAGINMINNPSPTIRYNNILGNVNYSIYLSFWSNATLNNIDALNNWWGTTDITRINQTIRDFKNDPKLGLVSFIPLLTGPNLAAPSVLSLNPNPSPSPSPSTTPVLTPTPTPTSTALPTAAPTTKYFITITHVGSGTITPSDGTYNEITSALSLKATPSTNYVFTCWLQNGTLLSTSNPYNFTPTNNYVITAVFDPTTNSTSTPQSTFTPSDTPKPTITSEPSPTQAMNPTPKALPTLSPSPNSTPSPTTSLMPSISEQKTPLPSLSKKPASTPYQSINQELPQEIVYGVLGAIAVAVIAATAIVTRRKRKARKLPFVIYY